MCNNLFMNFLTDKILGLVNERYIRLERERDYYKNKCRKMELEKTIEKFK